MAVATDVQIKGLFERNTEGFALLSKTRQDLSSLIPQAAGAQDVANDPSVVGIKEQLAVLETIRQGKEKVMNDGVALHDNLNAVEELMQVNSGAANKGEVFERFKAQYVEHFAQNEAFE